MSDQAALVALERRGRTAVVELRRPEVLNALDPPLLAALRDVVRSLEDDDAVGAVVLAGAGRSFMAGGDVRAMAAMNDGELAAFVDDIQELTRTLRASRLPVVCAVHGPTVGGGCEIACACDLRIAAAGATFAFPEVNLGLVVTSGVTFLLPRLIGAGWAARLLLTGQTVTAETAARIGLVEEVVAEESLRGAAVELADRLAATDPLALRLLKHGLARGGSATLDEALRAEADAVAACVADGTARARLQGLVDRRDRDRPGQREGAPTET